MPQGGAGIGGGASGPSRAYKSLPYKNYQDLDPWVQDFVDSIGFPIDVLNALFFSSAGRAALLNPAATAVSPASSHYASQTAAPTGAASTDTMLDVLLFLAGIPWPVDTNFTTAQRQALVGVGPGVRERKGVRRELLRLAAQILDGVLYGWTLPPFSFSEVVGDGGTSPGNGSWVQTNFGTARTGTVTVTNGSAAIVGVGTLFTTEMMVGRKFTTDRATTYVVQSITDDLHLTLTTNYGGTTLGGQTYYTNANGTQRPPLYASIRNLLARVYPAFATLGVGPTQARAGFSAAGEPLLSAGATISQTIDEHFYYWNAAGTLATFWTYVGPTAAARVDLSTDSNINPEFGGFAAKMDLSTSNLGDTHSLSQGSLVLNNQLTQRFELDYSYYNAQQVNRLEVIITDNNLSTSPRYWNATTQSWSSTAYSNLIPVCTSSGVRQRYAFDIIPQQQTTADSQRGTDYLQVAMQVVCDGTSTTKTTYKFYRCAVYPKFDYTQEQLAGGERIMWLPLRDAVGYTNSHISGPTGGTKYIEPANGQRSMTKSPTTGSPAYPYHPAITGRGCMMSNNWTNLIKGSGSMTGADWTLGSCFGGANTASPEIGGSQVAALQNSATTGTLTQTNVAAAPASNTYVGGVWFKLITVGTATVTLQLISTNTYSVVHSVSSTSGWRLLPLPATNTAAGDVAAMSFKISVNAGNGAQWSVYNAYCYDTSDRPDIMFPPVVQTGVGATGSRGSCYVEAMTNGGVKDFRILRSQASILRGMVNMKVVPMLSAGTANWPSVYTLMDIRGSGGASTDRLWLRIDNNILTLTHWDHSSVARVATLTLTKSKSPSAGQVTWRRDTSIQIHAIWNTDSISLSAGNGNAATVAAGTGVDGTLSHIDIGGSGLSGSNFEGIIRDVEIIQLGAPAA